MSIGKLTEVLSAGTHRLFCVHFVQDRWHLLVSRISLLSQASWGRLQMKPKKKQRSRFRHVDSQSPSAPIQSYLLRDMLYWHKFRRKKQNQIHTTIISQNCLPWNKWQKSSQDGRKRRLQITHYIPRDKVCQVFSHTAFDT